MQDDTRDPPAWKLVAIVILWTLAWPAFAIFNLWGARRFYWINLKAYGWKHRVVSDGIEAWRKGEPAVSIPWTELAKARWVSHSVSSMASGPEDYFAVDIRARGVALSELQPAGNLASLFHEVSQRFPEPKIVDGGRDFGLANWLLMMLWTAALCLGLVIYFHAPLR
jgi:hypothetical protein